jgi:hypothetical protein
MTIGRFPKSRQFSLKPNFAEFGQIAKVQFQACLMLSRASLRCYAPLTAAGFPHKEFLSRSEECLGFTALPPWGKYPLSPLHKGYVRDTCNFSPQQVLSSKVSFLGQHIVSTFSLKNQ